MLTDADKDKWREEWKKLQEKQSPVEALSAAYGYVGASKRESYENGVEFLIETYGLHDTFLLAFRNEAAKFIAPTVNTHEQINQSASMFIFYLVKFPDQTLKLLGALKEVCGNDLEKMRVFIDKSVEYYQQPEGKPEHHLFRNPEQKENVQLCVLACSLPTQNFNFSDLTYLHRKESIQGKRKWLEKTNIHPDQVDEKKLEKLLSLMSVLPTVGQELVAHDHLRVTLGSAANLPPSFVENLMVDRFTLHLGKHPDQALQLLEDLKKVCGINELEKMMDFVEKSFRYFENRDMNDTAHHHLFSNLTNIQENLQLLKYACSLSTKGETLEEAFFMQANQRVASSAMFSEVEKTAHKVDEGKLNKVLDFIRTLPSTPQQKNAAFDNLAMLAHGARNKGSVLTVIRDEKERLGHPAQQHP